MYAKGEGVVRPVIQRAEDAVNVSRIKAESQESCICYTGAPYVGQQCGKCRAGYELNKEKCEGSSYLCTKVLVLGAESYNYCFEMLESYRDYKGDFKFTHSTYKAALSSGGVTIYQNIHINIGVRPAKSSEALVSFQLAQGCCSFITSNVALNLTVLKVGTIDGLVGYFDQFVGQNLTISTRTGEGCFVSKTSMLASKAIGEVKLAGTLWTFDRIEKPALIGKAVGVRLTLINSKLPFQAFGSNAGSEVVAISSSYQKDDGTTVES